MTLTAGTLSQGAVYGESALVNSTPATGGTGPYTQQWYMSTSSGFSPGPGNILAGQTGLSAQVSGLIPNTPYYFKVIYTDTGHSNDTVTATQLAITTTAMSLSQNQFAQTPVLGMVDLAYSTNTVSVQIDASQGTTLYAGAAVKLVDSAGGVPKVIGVTSASDDVFGFLNYDIKNVGYSAGEAAEVSCAGNYMYMYAAAAIARGAEVMVSVSPTPQGAVATAAGSGSNIVGFAYDKASAAGELIRVAVRTPSYKDVP